MYNLMKKIVDRAIPFWEIQRFWSPDPIVTYQNKTAIYL